MPFLLALIPLTLGLAAVAEGGTSKLPTRSRERFGARRTPMNSVPADPSAVVPAPLSFPMDALEPDISLATMAFHHDVLHAAYLQNARSRAAALSAGSGTPEDVDAEAYATAGDVLHRVYWATLSPVAGVRMPPELTTRLAQAFGSTATFGGLLFDLVRRIGGPGWVVLGYEPMNKRLLVYTVRGHLDGHVPGAIPILAVDAWEHAYQRDWGADRDGFLWAWLRHVDWSAVLDRLRAAEAA